MITGSATRLVWDADIDALDLRSHQRAIIVRVLHYGNLQDWRWLIEQYGEAAVRAEALAAGGSSGHPRTQRLVSLLYA